MAASWQRIDQAAEERPWLTGLATGVPAGIVLAVVLAVFDGGEAFAEPLALLGRGVVQGLVIGVLVAGGGIWRRRVRQDQQGAVDTPRERDSDARRERDPDA